MKKRTRQYYEQENESLRPLAQELRNLLQQIPGAKEYLSAHEADLVKEKVEEKFLGLVRAIKEAANLDFKIEPIAGFPKKMTRSEYGEAVRLDALRGFLLEAIKAVATNESDFFLNLHYAVKFEFTGQKTWKRVYDGWIFLKEELGRFPTCAELLERLRPRYRQMEKRTLLDICKRLGLSLSKGKSGRPKKIEK